ncbi:MAG: hypothetical protein ABJD24_01420 [Acidimicrobiales bacterium]
MFDQILDQCALNSAQVTPAVGLTHPSEADDRFPDLSRHSLEYSSVAVGARKEHSEPVAALDPLSAEHVVAGGGPGVAGDGARPAENLFGRRSEKRVIVAQRFHLLAVLDEGDETRRDRVARGPMPAIYRWWPFAYDPEQGSPCGGQY